MSQAALAKRMFLILHNPFTGKQAVGDDLLRCAVVCAELADLMLQRRLGMEGELVVLAPNRLAASDEISAFVIDSIQQQAGAHTVRTWASAFADVLHELVARALVAEGVVRREKRGRALLRRGGDRFPAVNLIPASAPRLELEHLLRNPTPSDAAGNVLAAILGALELERALDVDADRTVIRAGIEAATAALPFDLRHLVAGVKDSAAAISLVVRR